MNQDYQPIDRNPTLPCENDDCDNTDRWENIKQDCSGWTYSNDPEVPMLCPDCSDPSPDYDRRQEENHGLGEFQEVA